MVAQDSRKVISVANENGGARHMSKLFNVIVDLQSVFAVALGAALTIGAFAKEYQDTALEDNLASAETKSAAATGCDQALPDELPACAPPPLPSDPIALWTLSPR
jgi:hypothetical protein